MFDQIVRFAVEKRLLVLAATVLLLLYGAISAVQAPIDVLPDFNRPLVTIFTEAHGLAPEEVETLVTFPIEAAVNGATNVVRVRSVSGIGLSIVFVEFDWDTDIYANRQVVAERLQSVTLPPEMTPVMGPITSIMGSISLVGFRSQTGEISPLELRTLVDWVVRPRLQAIPGVSQVINLGGGVKQYQVLVSPEKLRQFNITLEQLETALATSNRNTAGGYLELEDKEYLVRNLGRVSTLEDIRNTVVDYSAGTPIYVRNLAQVAFGEQVKRGDAGLNGESGVISNVFMQPGANTVTVTAALDRALDELQLALPSDIEIEREIFRQANFIRSAVTNMWEALRDASILVLIVLPIFLLNFRTTAVTITAIPLSFVLMLVVMRTFGFTINTMTLGGLALAVGELVDDAIVGVENVYRRLKEAHPGPTRQPLLEEVRKATVAGRAPIRSPTYLVAQIFIPLFFLTGVEARILMPLGIAFILSIIASTVIAVTVIPALCAYLLPQAGFLQTQKESLLARWLKRAETQALEVSLRHPWKIVFVTGLAFLIALSMVPFMGLEFIPPFNEGSFTVNVLAEPGIALSASNRIGGRAEQLLLEIPEVRSTG
ncbi:MAG: efflux RND transporter permease subunit, partial [Acidobacteriota bacterium]